MLMGRSYWLMGVCLLICSELRKSQLGAWILHGFGNQELFWISASMSLKAIGKLAPRSIIKKELRWRVTVA